MRPSTVARAPATRLTSAPPREERREETAPRASESAVLVSVTTDCVRWSLCQMCNVCRLVNISLDWVGEESNMQLEKYLSSWVKVY